MILHGCDVPGFISTTTSYNNIEGYITTLDQSRKLERFKPELKSFIGGTEQIEINTSKRYQVMEGFGYTLTGGSAQHLIGLPNNQRNALLF